MKRASNLSTIMAFATRLRVAISLTIGLGMIVAVATLTPQAHMPPAPPGGDKLHHFLAFGALAMPMAYARPQSAVWVVLLVSAYGALIEIIRPHVGRHGDVMDALANAVGATTGAVGGALLRRLIEAVASTPSASTRDGARHDE